MDLSWKTAFNIVWCRKHWWRLWRTPTTLATQYFTLGCATTRCSRLSSQGKPDSFFFFLFILIFYATREVAGYVNTYIERCAMKN
ncbi:hypothetical protein GOBAR_AA12406 [Gossypium barbadense]|uniref:Uncharacterized protein n=1 Tax=Gossypium barbadense TaxID=3634 RepID=A0A2P5XY17_GOSBA|nr:hypothetical protein GOBAR_AA12406 [Gossypium barbadense]